MKQGFIKKKLKAQSDLIYILFNLIVITFL